ncbi:MAG: YebC/PmpR family DNA-binding transcriptional regulator [Bacilli bacterium]
MSGHSKWANIKRRKGAQDAIRGNIFQKLAKEIYVAAKSGDKDPNNNPTLRMVIDKAKSENMPKDKIQNAIDKASKQIGGEDYEAIRYEGYGPGGIAVMVDCLTDNKNRTAPEIRSAFSKKNGNLGTDGSVSYLFERKGIIIIDNKYNEEDVMMTVIDAGAEDLTTNEDNYEIITPYDKFIDVKKALETLGIEEFMVSEVTFLPKVEIEVDDNIKEKVFGLVETLEENEDVQNVYHNMKE